MWSSPSPVVQIVENLERHAQVAGELLDRLDVLLGRPGQPHAGIQGRFEGRRRLQGVNLQGIERREPLVARVAPQQLGPLPFGEPQVGVGQAIENVGDDVRARASSTRG